MSIIWYVGSKLAKIINEIIDRDCEKNNKNIKDRCSKDRTINNNKTRYYNNIHKRLIRRNFTHNKFIK